MPLAEDIEDFRRDITKAVEALEEIRWLTDKLTECTVDELYSKIAQLQDLCEQVVAEIKLAGEHLIEINTKWGSESFKKDLKHKIRQNFYQGQLQQRNISLKDQEIDLNSYEDGSFIKLIQSIIKAQDDLHPFQNSKQAKGIIGESLCHILLGELFPSSYFLEGQLGEYIDTVSEELAYKSAQEFLSQHPEYEYAVTERPFGGGQPYSLDVVCMIINRKDVENWVKKRQSTATYFVFESKTDSARLSTAQSQFSYVQRQALYMFKNRNNIEDRSQLGQDLLQAVSKNKVVYVTSHVDTESGKMKIQFIQ
jgi:hypothetical protein